ncbi:MAG: hypothetical protein ACOZD0_01905 [Pseudomonadota bacterium]
MDALLLAALQVLLACWIQIRLRASIKHEYDKKLEEFKREHERREKAAVIAEFMAEWTHIKDSDTKKLNQLLWELTLYLPSHLVKDINAMSTKAPGAKTPSQVLVAVRSYLLNDADRITEDDVTHFKHPGNASMYSSSQR